MNKPVRTKTPSGEDITILPTADYERLMEIVEETGDRRDSEIALLEIAAGSVELLTHVEVTELLAAPTPLAFWRRRRGLTQAALADAVGISQAYLAQIEGGKRTGDVKVYQRVASVLRVDVDDLLIPLQQTRPATRKARRKK
jgi:DNA-binding XRE family transcriptional regulator